MAGKGWLVFPPSLFSHQASFMKFNRTWRSDRKRFPPTSSASQVGDFLRAAPKRGALQGKFKCRFSEFGENKRDKRLRSQIAPVIYGAAGTTDGPG